MSLNCMWSSTVFSMFETSITCNFFDRQSASFTFHIHTFTPAYTKKQQPRQRVRCYYIFIATILGHIAQSSQTLILLDYSHNGPSMTNDTDDDTATTMDSEVDNDSSRRSSRAERKAKKSMKLATRVNKADDYCPGPTDD